MILLLALLACTPADRALLEVPVVVEARSGGTLVPARGVEVVLDEATVTLGALRLEEAEPLARRSLSPLAVAHAHPGHDAPGTIGGELLGTWTVDLLAEGTLLGSAAVYEGDFEGARLELPGPPGAAVAGTATVDGVERPFRIEVAPAREVTTIPFPETVVAPGPARLALGRRFP